MPDKPHVKIHILRRRTDEEKTAERLMGETEVIVKSDYESMAYYEAPGVEIIHDAPGKREVDLKSGDVLIVVRRDPS